MSELGGLRTKWGLALSISVVLLDQATKQWALHTVSSIGAIEVTGFFNLVLVWNSGVSFGLFQNDAEMGKWLLIGLAAAISGVILYLLRKETKPLPILAYWLVLAGAFGNVVDRLIYGAVIDFLDFHLNNYHWPAFNVADSAIVIGAGALILDALTSKDSMKRDEQP